MSNHRPFTPIAVMGKYSDGIHLCMNFYGKNAVKTHRTLYCEKPPNLMDIQTRQRSHYQIHIFIFQLVNNVQIGFLCGSDAGVS
ncbi:hypothetical protein [Avibacterium paragallinarum]|nr:hypothetical protein [Avibacterium paragallinarum]